MIAIFGNENDKNDKPIESGKGERNLTPEGYPG